MPTACLVLYSLDDVSLLRRLVHSPVRGLYELHMTWGLRRAPESETSPSMPTDQKVVFNTMRKSIDSEEAPSK